MRLLAELLKDERVVAMKALVETRIAAAFEGYKISAGEALEEFQKAHKPEEGNKEIEQAVMKTLLAIPFFLASDVIATGAAAAAVFLKACPGLRHDLAELAKGMIEKNGALGGAVVEAGSEAARDVLSKLSLSKPKTALNAVTQYVELLMKSGMFDAGQALIAKLKPSHDIWDHAVALATVERLDRAAFRTQFSRFITDWADDIFPTQVEPRVHQDMMVGRMPGKMQSHKETTQQLVVHVIVDGETYLVDVMRTIVEIPRETITRYVFLKWAHIDGDSSIVVDYDLIRDFPKSDLRSATRLQDATKYPLGEK